MRTKKHFCGITMPAEYDDGAALRAYVWRHFRHLMTPLERRVTEYDVPILSDTDHDKARKIYEFLEGRDGHVEDADVRATFEIPRDIRKKEAVDRVIADHADSLMVNRCPRCSGIARTPIARQCPWCGNSWR